MPLSYARVSRYFYSMIAVISPDLDTVYVPITSTDLFKALFAAFAADAAA